MIRGALLALVLALPAVAGEERVALSVAGAEMAGTLALPEAAAGPVPAVLLLHGFLGTRDELAVAGTGEGVFARTARVLAEAGWASLRIDFRGSGDSGGAWADTTFSGQAIDAARALGWLAAHPAVDPARVAVLGWSQGGLVAAHVAAARPDAVAAVVLWAPVNDATDVYARLLGADTLARALAMPSSLPVTAALPWGGETTLKASFFHEMPATDPVAALARYTGPALIMVGTRDTLVAPQPAAGEVFARYHPGPTRVSVRDTDHIFGVDTGPEVLDDMLAETLAWLAEPGW
ncbi:MAG: alpha/beta fold hydrolase [Rhodobacteraceae bacterium]|nr:alpha/beta fold hydrolase [Paracoccaceae bacterium]